MEQTTGSRRVRVGLMVAMVAMSVPFVFAQQKDCSDGVFHGKFENGTIEICPRFASQFPALQRQLTEMSKTQGEEKEQIRDLKRLINGSNSVTQKLGEKRQINRKS